MKELALFHSKLPKDVLAFLNKVSEQGFKSGIIGGCTRDWLREKTLSHDVDVELRPTEDLEERELLSKFKSLIELLSKDYSVYEKGYNVHEVSVGEYSLELGLPRLEIFNNTVGHSNFTAKFVSDMDYSNGFKRRDFTLNAIMFEYYGGQWRLVDPLNGVQDLKLGLLRACDNVSFVKDPVRFLRAVRFSVKLNLEMELSLIALLKNMELSLNSHYLRLETQKGQKPLTMLSVCCELRPSVFPFEFLSKHQILIEEYERSFRMGELKQHIAQCLFLTLPQRQAVLKFLELKQKSIVEINLKEINLGKIKILSLADLSNLSWSSQMLQLIAKAGEFDQKKLDWILKEEGVEFGVDFLEKYEELKIEIPKEVPNKLKNYYLLQEKTKILTS